jgi:hypothetical protein
MKTIVLSLLILFSATYAINSVQAQPAAAQDQNISNQKPPGRKSTDNSFRIVRIVKGETWRLDEGDGKKLKVLSRLSEDQTLSRTYILPALPDSFSPIPRWRINGDFLYMVSLRPGSERLGHTLMKVRVRDLKELPTEEMIKRSGGMISSPRGELLSLVPLNRAFAMQNQNLNNKTRWDEPLWYDFLISDDEKCTLVIITEGKISVWELDTRNESNWKFLSLDDEKKYPRAGAPSEWKQVVEGPAPFSTRFAADLQEGQLTLISEFGDVWRADGQYHFLKFRDAAALSGGEVEKPGVENFLIEDADNKEIWLADRASTGADRRTTPVILVGSGAKSAERIGKVIGSIKQ